MVEISRRLPATLVQVATWPAGADAVARMLERQPAIRLQLSPGCWLLVSDQPGLDLALDPGAGVVTDLSDARAIFRIEGADAPDVLRKGIGFDLDARRFGPDAVAQTPVHGISILVHRLSATGFDLYVPASFAAAFEAWLTDAAIASVPPTHRGPAASVGQA